MGDDRAVVGAQTRAEAVVERGPRNAARAFARGKSLFTKDLPVAKETYDKMAPYLPSLARLIYVEAKEKLPAPKEAWQQLMRKVVPSACLRHNRFDNGPRKFFGQRCLNNNMRNAGRLPNQCHRAIWTNRGQRNVFAARCLRRNGWVFG